MIWRWLHILIFRIRISSLVYLLARNTILICWHETPIAIKAWALIRGDLTHFDFGFLSLETPPWAHTTVVDVAALRRGWLWIWYKSGYLFVGCSVGVEYGDFFLDILVEAENKTDSIMFTHQITSWLVEIYETHYIISTTQTWVTFNHIMGASEHNCTHKKNLKKRSQMIFQTNLCSLLC